VQETEEQRRNRELIELLNELRVALPGVQVLFAFLLAVPFQRGWPHLPHHDRALIYVALLSTAVSTALLIAPSSYHRLRWRERDKEYLLETSNKLTIAGLACLALSVNCVVFVVSDFLYGYVAAIPVTAALTVLFAALWYGLPFRRALQDRRRARLAP
jgi:4-amino-4-deoxy-L-arabinose transferase-like glycosyltransferase